MDTLVLNSAYLPIDRISWMDAIGDLLTGRAEVVDVYENVTVRSGSNCDRNLSHSFLALATEQTGVWRVPSIIRFLTRAVFPKRSVKFNRHNVWLRDGGRCQYCNVKLRTEEFTYDHVLPQSRGGKTQWENIVCACIPCNHLKGNRTPAEARLRLLREPFRPTQLPGQLSPAMAWKEGMPESWRSFLESVRYWHGGLSAT
jgi:5-methylcytosine-specific restriction endonuclease McrA